MSRFNPQLFYSNFKDTQKPTNPSKTQVNPDVPKPPPIHEKIIIPSYKACEMASQTMKFLSLLKEAMSLKTSLPPKGVCHPKFPWFQVFFRWPNQEEGRKGGIWHGWNHGSGWAGWPMDGCHQQKWTNKRGRKLTGTSGQKMLPKCSVSLVIIAEREMSSVIILKWE